MAGRAEPENALADGTGAVKLRPGGHFEWRFTVRVSTDALDRKADGRSLALRQ